ncbi:competence/damage-inducible protein A [Mangrovibacillus cuniculi]|uniref:Putative competence-damage inducible protein n=1 Tax=Mangrovibacillus cuniculi TaxID=2593652 RepID=A0A7S8CAH6_9BACI|nr:competence/damage-inducible protein A [Mangrovibacillus cuniculi]QPC46412.1 competence/damage-inducible protein A [Mangrovibacillus cuniculi]
MKAEIIAIGTELLLGQITNSNATYISSQSASAGIFVYHHTAVGDNKDRLEKVIQIAEDRSDLLIFTGGLGPTKDDLTKETIAKHLGTPLVLDKMALENIKDWFTKMNREMTPNNEKQALILEGSYVLKNDYGMAPGMVYEKAGKTYVLLPGPPNEMKPMVDNYLIPYLLSKRSDGSVLTSRVLKFYGIGEADLEHQLQDIIDEQSNPTVAPLAGDGEVTLRLTAFGENSSVNKKLLDEMESTIAKRVGAFIYGYDQETLWSSLLNKLRHKNLTLAVAESFTAGLFQSTFAAEAGASSVLKGGVVCYDKSVKTKLLKLDEETLESNGVYSEWCARELALSVRRLLNTSIGISFTGVAGPGAHANVDPGTIFMGIAWGEEEVETVKLSLVGSREAIRNRAVKWMADHLRKKVEQLK